MYYHFRVHKEKKGYSTECIELEGCYTEGDTMREVRENAEDALESYLCCAPGEKEDRFLPLPNLEIEESDDIIEIGLKNKKMIEFLVGQIELHKNITRDKVLKEMEREPFKNYIIKICENIKKKNNRKEILTFIIYFCLGIIISYFTYFLLNKIHSDHILPTFY